MEVQADLSGHSARHRPPPPPDLVVSPPPIKVEGSLHNIDISTPDGEDAAPAGRSTRMRDIVAAYCSTLDVEALIFIMMLVFIFAANAIFTRDNGWITFRTPLTDEPDNEAVISVGLQTYTGDVMAIGVDGVVISSFTGFVQEVSPEGQRVSAFLYVCLVVTLLLAAGLLWYFALFFRYLKQFAPFTPNRGRDLAIKGLGMFAICLSLLLLSFGTIAYPSVLIRDFRDNPRHIADLSKLELLDMSAQMEYAYKVTVAAWFFLMIGGVVLVVRGNCKRRRAAERGRSPPHGERNDV